MTPSLADWQEFYDLVRPYAAKDRVSVHYGFIAAAPKGKRGQSSDCYVVWIGNKCDRSNKSLCHAARKAITQYETSYGSPEC